jgi:predicted enzyme related to lactoylglutathione lyase
VTAPTSQPVRADLRRLIVSVSSLEQSLAFYGEVLGLRLDSSTDELAHLATGDGTEVMLHQRPAQATDAGVAVGFVVEDLSATVHAWRARGGSVIDPPEIQPWGEFMAVVRDPDGHIVCLSGRPQ